MSLPIRTEVKLLAALLASSFPLTSALAAPVTYRSGSGNDTNPCSFALPCATFQAAQSAVDDGGQVLCLDSSAAGDNFSTSLSFTLDCSGTFMARVTRFAGIGLTAPNEVVKIRNLTMDGLLATQSSAIKVFGASTLIIENCVFQNFDSVALDIETNSPLNLVINHSRISNASSGVLLKPAAGGSIKATFSGVTITANSGGGIRTDTTNGAVNLDVADSEISNNAGNGINLIGGAGGQNMLNLSRSVIAKSGAAGLQSSGANAAALVDSTLFDTNASGATAVVAGGQVFSYVNNRIVGWPGAGFTGQAGMQ